MLSQHIKVSPDVMEILDRIWPARVTIILNWKQNSQNKLSSLLNTSKKRTLACRVPKHEVLLSILQEVGVPIVGTSANVTGTPPSFNFSVVRQNLPSNKIDLWVDDGVLPQRLPSTIVDITNSKSPKIIRQGDFDFLEIWKKHLTKSLN
jgi:L-threonylcarbamoyladenylate synthase